MEAFALEKLECYVCDSTFKCKSVMLNHCKTIRHIKKVDNFNLVIENKKLNNKICSIPLKNKSGKIIAFTDVDSDIVDKIIQYPIFLGTDLYAYISINGIGEHLHSYIYYTIYGNEKTKGMMLDHNDRVKLNNCISNLEKVTAIINARNRNKLATASSKYWGVSWDKDENKWTVLIADDNKVKHKFRYNDELHAAWHYNLLIKELNLKGYNLNDIKEPLDFIRKMRQPPHTKKLPVAVERQSKSKYRYTIGEKHFGGFLTPEAASAAREKKLLKKSQEKSLELKKLLESDIKRNKKGQAIIDIFNKNKIKTAEIFVEDSVYYKLLTSTLFKSDEGYVDIIIDGKRTRLSRYLKNCIDINLKVDHRDGNVYNHMEKNLKVTDALGIAQNKSSRKNSTSKYVGVSLIDRKREIWRATISYNKICANLGLFKNEQEACIVRDLRAFELNMLGNNYKINLPEEELQYHLLIKSLTQENFDFNYLFFTIPELLY